jgi:hypothetical protein
MERTPSTVALLVLGLAPLATDPALAISLEASGPEDRGDETVTISGASLAPLIGRPIGELALYCYNAATGHFDPIPFQIDERFLKVFDAGLPSQFSEMVYDVFGEDDGLLDADDEIVFQMADAGPRAPIAGVWVPGAEAVRFEISIDDPRPSGGTPREWAYIFTGPGLPTFPTGYVTWGGQPDSSVTTDVFRLDYDGNWVTSGLTVFGPCGSGADLIDRFKGRAEPGIGEQRQDEEDWSANSTYLGGISGPVRAIRYVRGARSGVNTIHHDMIQRSGWERHINLRVHELDSVWIYFDWLPDNGSILYTPDHPGGLTVDGVPDAGGTSAYVDWHLMKTASGGLFVHWDVPTSPLFQSREFFYVDDASHNDTVPSKSTYPDDDDSAYGAHGVRIVDTLDSNLTPIRLDFSAIPLCAGEGDLSTASALDEIIDFPLQPDPVPQANCGAVRTVTASRDGADVGLEWQPATGADAYRVYVAGFPDLAPVSWSMASEGPALTYRDTGGASGGNRFYSVVCTSQGAEGPR